MEDYRHHAKSKLMTLSADEFIRRFPLRTLPDGFHRIRHYGFLAKGRRTAKLALCRTLHEAEPPPVTASADRAQVCPHFDRCRACGGIMVTISVVPPPGRRAPRTASGATIWRNRPLETRV